MQRLKNILVHVTSTEEAQPALNPDTPKPVGMPVRAVISSSCKRESIRKQENKSRASIRIGHLVQSPCMTASTHRT